MSRALSAALLAQIIANQLRPVVFYEGTFNSGTLRLWSGLTDISWNDVTWRGAGDLLSVSEVSESAEIRADGLTLSLSGLNDDIISAALGQGQRLPGKVWIGALGREGYLSLPGSALNYASTPDSVANSITGDSSMVVEIVPDDYTPAASQYLMAKSASPANMAQTFFLKSTGHLGFSWLVSVPTIISVESTASYTADLGRFVRVDHDVNNGAGGNTVTFYTSHDEVTWTQLGSAVVTAGTTSVFNSSAVLEIGSNNSGFASRFAGKIYSAKLYNGIMGTPVCVFNPSADGNRGNTSLTSSATGEVWTVNQFSSPRAEIIMDDAVVIADPFLAFEGRLDVPDIIDDGETCTVTVSYESRLIDLERPRERRITHEDQQIDYPGDRFREYVAGLQDQVIIW